MTIWVGEQFLNEGFNMFSVWFLGFWGHQYQGHDPSEVSTTQRVDPFLLIVQF